jgi:hypothetical protein
MDACRLKRLDRRIVPLSSCSAIAVLYGSIIELVFSEPHPQETLEGDLTAMWKYYDSAFDKRSLAFLSAIR